MMFYKKHSNLEKLQSKVSVKIFRDVDIFKLKAEGALPLHSNDKCGF